MHTSVNPAAVNAVRTGVTKSSAPSRLRPAAPHQRGPGRTQARHRGHGDVVASQWVLDGTCDGFPLLHHWRVLPQDPPRGLDCAEHGDLDTWVAFWHDSDAVRQRLEALSEASANVVLFLEHVPQDLLTWLADRHAEGPEVVDVVLGSVLTQLVRAASCMATEGFRHFDAHLRNIVVDGDQLYLTDFGLAASCAFLVTAEEADFLDSHAAHDVAYVVTELVNWVVTSLTKPSRTWTHPLERNDYVRACAGDYEPPELLPTAASVVRRYAPVAAVMNDFYFALHGSSRRTPYPEEDVRMACRAAGRALEALGGVRR